MNKVLKIIRKARKKHTSYKQSCDALAQNLVGEILTWGDSERYAGRQVEVIKARFDITNHEIEVKVKTLRSDRNGYINDKSWQSKFIDLGYFKETQV